MCYFKGRYIANITTVISTKDYSDFRAVMCRDDDSVGSGGR